MNTVTSLKERVIDYRYVERMVVSGEALKADIGCILKFVGALHTLHERYGFEPSAYVGEGLAPYQILAELKKHLSLTNADLVGGVA